jgi:glucan 1,3-beta-glucosidase
MIRRLVFFHVLIVHFADIAELLQIYIAETGWPTGANETEFTTYQAAIAGVPELNTFLADYVCQANQNITSGGQFSSYFYFEAFDESWKEIYGG